MIESDTFKKSRAILSLKPGAEFNLRGDTLEWLDKVQTQPTDSEITAEIERLKNLDDYQTPRKKEYPSIEDQLDLIYHSGIDAWKAKIKETKDKYPKPS